ncbi:MAG: Similar to F420-dependent glucose-6-phosphate dehydrogenase, Mext_1273 family, partial [uncultured Frankineae bacterium]
DRRPRLPRAGPPLEADRGRAARRAGRLHGRHVLGPPLAVERAAGPVGVRLVVARRGAAGHEPAVRRRQRAGAALPPGDHRAGDGHADGDVPRPLLDRARHRRGLERARDRPGVAAQGGPQRPARRVRGRHPPPARRRGGQPRRARHRRPCARLDAARGAAAAHRRRRQPGHRLLGRLVGGRPGHGAAAARRPPQDRGRLPQRRRAGTARAAGPPVLGRGRRDGARHRPRPVAQQRLRAGRQLEPRPRLAVRRGVQARAARGDAGAGARLGRPGSARHLAAGPHRARLRRGLPAPRRAGADPLARGLRGEGAAAARRHGEGPPGV